MSLASFPIGAEPLGQGASQAERVAKVPPKRQTTALADATPTPEPR